MPDNLPGDALSLAELLGLDTTSENACQAQNLLVYAHPLNSDVIALGESDIAANKHMPIPPGLALPVNADDSDSDEDLVFVDLRDIFVYCPSPGQILIVTRLEQVASTY